MRPTWDRQWDSTCIHSLFICLFRAVVIAAASGAVEESGDAGDEVPEAVTVEVEETHPLPEVSADTTSTMSSLMQNLK